MFMSNTLYSLLILLYDKVLFIASFFHEKAREKVQHKDNYKGQINKRDKSKKLIWFHCASLGEFEQGRPVIEAFKKANLNWQVLLTFYSPSGYNVRKGYTGADMVCYLPSDLPKNVKLFLEAFEPELAIFVKYEFWHNYINELYLSNIPVISISTILRPNQYFFKWYGSFGKKTLGKISHFFVQNAETKQLLEAIHISNITLAGDTRFDRVLQTLQQIQEISIAATFKNGQKLLVAGSVWQQDMDVLIPVLNKLKIKAIIAPHEVDRNAIDTWKSEINSMSISYSEITPQSDLKNTDILFIDNVGMLSALYQYANMAYVGGAFGAGLHNILEAATFGVPIFFGNKSFTKFKEAEDLIVLKTAHAVSGGSELREYMEMYLKDDAITKWVHQINTEYIKEHTGATDLILNYLTKTV